MAVDFKQALDIVLNSAEELSCENVIIGKAVGRILREDIVAQVNIPPFPNSAMDGFCVRSEDLVAASEQNPVKLKIIGDIPAGSSTDTVLGPGQAIRIMTGAPVPMGADTVVRQEDVKENGGEVLFFLPEEVKQNIRQAGEDIPVGTVVLETGKLLTPADLGVLASLGRIYVRVSEQPRVSILATGDELIAVDEPLSKGKIRSSNTYSLMGLIAFYGGKSWNQGKIADDKNRIKERLYDTENADIILTIGGVSVGKYDVVKEALRELGVEEKFWGVKMKPGKPLFFGKWGKRLVFGLPGNPVSSIVCFEQFVLPLMNKMMGRSSHFLPVVKAKLMRKLVKKPGLRHFYRGQVVSTENGYEVTPYHKQGSGMLATMSHANCLIIGPEDVEALKEGETVKIVIRDFSEWI